MEAWNTIINKALLGTEKGGLRKEDLPADLAGAHDAIIAAAPDREEVFLQLAALTYNYRQCGLVPLTQEATAIAPAAPEEKQYASAFAHGVLSELQESGSSLLRLWLEHCAAKNEIVQPEKVPSLLDIATKESELRALIQDCCGNRGAWLAQFNPQWGEAVSTDPNELFETGTPSERITALQQIGDVDPQRATELLQLAWPKESAATKAELLEAFAPYAGESDVPWLEALLAEKSVKVRDAALKVLKTLPPSSIVQQYWAILKESVRMVTSKGLLGFGSKTSLQIQLARVDSAIFKTGIQELSGQAKESDEAFVLYQLMGAVPPNLWEEQLRMEPEKILELFAKEHKALLPAFGLAATRFKNISWLRLLIKKDEGRFYPDAVRLLPQPEAEAYALTVMNEDDAATATVLHNIDAFSEEWNQYNRAFFGRIAHLLPVSALFDLEALAPKEEHLASTWKNTAQHIARLITLKSDTLKAFNH
jgi:hypothetical protein